MNLSPRWIEVFERNGWQAVHWSTVGDHRTQDKVIMDWVKANEYLVFTHDLDFGVLLALNHSECPSVIQVRAQDVLPEHLGGVVIAAMKEHETLLEEGALIVVDESTNRVRILPIKV